MAPQNSIDRAVRRARPGAVLRVPAGTHRWSAAPSGPITILGEGARSTHLLVSARIATSEELALQELTLVADATALEIDGGDLTLSGVVIESVGSALFVHGGGAASIRRATMKVRKAASDLPVIEVRDDRSELSPSDSTLDGRYGLYVHAGAKARLSEAHLRALVGPCLRIHAASVELERCTIERARESGLYARDGAHVAIRACTFRRSAYAQIESCGSFVRMVGGALEAGEDDGVYAHDGATIELESVRLSGNDTGVRIVDSRASLREVVVTDGRGPAAAAGKGATVVVYGSKLEAGEYAALEAFDGGNITATGCVCRTDDDPTLAYDGGTVELAPAAPLPASLDAQRCWEMIAEARAAAPRRGDVDGTVAEELVEALARTGIPTIVAFHRFVRERMAEAYRWDLWAVAYIMNGGCSDDGFDYFLGWLVGQGRERFSAALRYPELAAAGYGPDDEPFSNEDMLAVGWNAYRKLTGATHLSDFYVVYTQPTPRRLVGKPFDEDTVYRDHPALARFA